MFGVSPHTHSQLTRYPPIYTPSSYRPSYFGLVLQRHHTLVQESKGDARVAPTVSVSHQVNPRVCHARGPHTGLCLSSLSAKTKLIISVVRLLSASSKKQKTKLPEVLVRGSSALKKGLFFSSYEELMLRGDILLCFWLLPFFLFLLTNQGGRTSYSRPLFTRGPLTRQPKRLETVKVSKCLTPQTFKNLGIGGKRRAKV